MPQPLDYAKPPKRDRQPLSFWITVGVGGVFVFLMALWAFLIWMNDNFWS